MTDRFETACHWCIERELATRLQRARAIALSRALTHIGRVKSLEKAQELAAAALQAEDVCIQAMDGVRMPDVITRPESRSD